MSKTNGTHRLEPSALLLAIGDAIPAHVALLDRNGTIRGVNRGWSDFAPQSWLPLPDPGMGANYLEICDGVHGRHADDARAIAAAIRDAIAGRARRLRLEYESGAPDDERCFELCVVSLEPADASTEPRSDDAAVLVAHRDITDAKIAKRKLEESLTQVRRLATHLLDVREEERRVVAREMHDELGHQLTALKIDVVALERELRRVSSSLASRAASMKTLFDQVIGTVRRLSSELRPGILDDFGLVTAIEWQIEGFEEQTGIAASFTLEGNDNGLSAPLQTAIFRILQESLSNIARHARADHVQILLRRDPMELHLEVRDNGAGLEPKKLHDPTSYGLTSMRERALGLGGAFRIDGLPGYGTTVSATLPLDCARLGQPPPPIASVRELASATS